MDGTYFCSSVATLRPSDSQESIETSIVAQDLVFPDVVYPCMQEMKKMRKQRREEREKEKQQNIQLGLMEAPSDKVMPVNPRGTPLVPPGCDITV